MSRRRSEGTFARRDRPSFGPSVGALVVTVVVFSFSGAAALDGIPNSDTGLFSMMAEVAGWDLPGITVASSAWLLVARLAGLGMLASAVGVIRTKRQLGRATGRTRT